MSKSTLYTRLEEREIRYLTIRPSYTNSAPVKCTMQRMVLRMYDKVTRFKALSYCWGTAPWTSIVSVNEQDFFVTPNLEAALRRMRGRLRGVNLWVDAICINQKDLLERNSQVRLMGDLYETADEVAVWLGEGNEQTAAAMNLIERVAQRIDDWWGSQRKEEAFERTQKRLYKILFPVAGNLAHWITLASLFYRPWWRRAWVRQEVAVAAKALLFVGNASQPWNSVLQVARAMFGFSKLISFSSVEIDDIVSLQEFQECYPMVGAIERLRANTLRHTGYRSVNTQDLVYYARECDSTDARDKVYAFLNVAGLEKKVTVDYTLTPEAIYRQFFEHLVARDEKLYVLGACQNFERKRGLPSWIPDLGSKFNHLPLQQIDGNSGLYSNIKRLYQASGDFKSDVRILDKIDALSVKGFQFDILKEISDIALQKTYKAKHVRNAIKAWILWVEKIPEFTPMDLDSRRRELCEVLSGGRHIPQPDIMARYRRGEEQSDSTHDDQFEDLVSEIAPGRRIGITALGHLCLLPGEAVARDELCILFGGKTPFVLRTESDGHVLVGETYVHGVMQGELFKDGRLDIDAVMRNFHIY